MNGSIARELASTTNLLELHLAMEKNCGCKNTGAVYVKILSTVQLWFCTDSLVGKHFELDVRRASVYQVDATLLSVLWVM